jgi:hypothetical protein
MTVEDTLPNEGGILKILFLNGEVVLMGLNFTQSEIR